MAKRFSVKENISGFLMITPLIIGILVFTALPVLLSIYYSFTDFDNITPPKFFSYREGGLDLFRQYVKAFKDERVLHSFGITFKFTFLSCTLSLALSFFLALFLNVRMRGIKAFRVLIYLPCIIPSVATASIWQDMFNPTYIGIINRMLSWVGIDPQPWFSSEHTAFASMILLSLWGIGGGMLIWISGFNGIAEYYYEAAELDGANKFKQLIFITLPMMSPIIFYNLITGVIGSLQSFGSAYLLTGGGPFYATNFIALNIYRTGISEFNMGYACAQAWLLFAVILILTLILFRTSGWVYYGDAEDKAK